MRRAVAPAQARADERTLGLSPSPILSLSPTVTLTLTLSLTCVRQPSATRHRGYPSVNSTPKRRRAAGLKAVSHAHHSATTASAGVPTLMLGEAGLSTNVHVSRGDVQTTIHASS